MGGIRVTPDDEVHVRVVETSPQGLDVVLVGARGQVDLWWYWLGRTERCLEQPLDIYR